MTRRRSRSSDGPAAGRPSSCPVALAILPFLALLAFARPGVGQERHPWPFEPRDLPRPVSNAYHSLQISGGSWSYPEAFAYFHGGIDIQVPEGTPVLAVTGGVPVPYTDRKMDNVRVTEPSGDVWEYRHLALGSVPEPVRRAAEGGEAIEAGTMLGRVAPWPNGFHHLHLNHRSAEGAILDPLDSLLPVLDRSAPEVRGIHLLPDGASEPWPEAQDGLVEAAGSLDIAVDALDSMEGAAFSNPPLSLRWRIDDERDWRVFDLFAHALPRAPRHPVPRFPTEWVGILYVLAGPLASENAIAAGKGDQRFVLVLTHVDAEGRPCPSGSWDSRSYPDGEHTLQVEARDAAGNTARSERRFRLRNADPPPRPASEPSLLDFLRRPVRSWPRLLDLGAAYAGDDLSWILELVPAGAEPLRVERARSRKDCALHVLGGGGLPFVASSLPLSLSTRGSATGALSASVDLHFAHGPPRRWTLRAESVPFLRSVPEEPVLIRARDGTLRARMLVAAEEPFALEGAWIRSDRGEFPVVMRADGIAGAGHRVLALEASSAAGEGTRTRLRIGTRLPSGRGHVTEWPLGIEDPRAPR